MPKTGHATPTTLPPYALIVDEITSLPNVAIADMVRTSTDGAIAELFRMAPLPERARLVGSLMPSSVPTEKLSVESYPAGLLSEEGKRAAKNGRPANGKLPAASLAIEHMTEGNVLQGLSDGLRTSRALKDKYHGDPTKALAALRKSGKVESNGGRGLAAEYWLTTKSE